VATEAEGPHIGSVRPGPTVGGILYLLLGASAAFALLGDRLTFVPFALQNAAPFIFGIFVVAFAVYRFAVVRAGRYPAAKAYFQVGAGVLLLAVLLTGTWRAPPPAEAGQPVDLLPLLSSADPAVRQLACEAARSRPDGAALVGPLHARENDPSPNVRAECERSLRALAH
jgi:hypothetical protein